MPQITDWSEFDDFLVENRPQQNNYTDLEIIDLEKTNDDDIIKSEIKKCREENLNILSIRNVDNIEILDDIKTLINLEGLEIMHLNCEIDKFDFLPEQLKNLIINNGSIEYLDCSTLPKTLESLILNFCDIKFVDCLPDNLILLDLESNKISFIESFPPNLKIIILNNNDLQKIPDLPEELEILELEKTDINTNLILPQSLKIFKISGCNLKNILKNIPKNLEELYAVDCDINYIDFEFAQNLKILNLENNDIDEISILPDSLEDINLSKNNLKCILNIPKNAKKIDLRRNPIELTKMPSIMSKYIKIDNLNISNLYNSMNSHYLMTNCTYCV